MENSEREGKEGGKEGKKAAEKKPKCVVGVLKSGLKNGKEESARTVDEEEKPGGCLNRDPIRRRKGKNYCGGGQGSERAKRRKEKKNCAH